MFLQNVGWLSTNYVALYPRRHNSSKAKAFQLVPHGLLSSSMDL
jgi:hypothetical protein